MNTFYHLCFAVPDLDRAIADMSSTLGVQWNPVREGKLGHWRFRIVFSRGGAPYFEVIEGDPGSPWDASAGARIDHIGYWSTDLEADQDELADRGAPADFDACPFGGRFSYHRLDSIGARIELVDAAGQQGFLETWDPEGTCPPTISFAEESEGS